MLKFHQFYRPKKYPEGYAEVLKIILPQLETAKTHLSQRKTFKKKQKIEGKNFSTNFFDEGLR